MNYRKIIFEKFLETLNNTGFVNELSLNEEERKEFIKVKREVRKEIQDILNSEGDPLKETKMPRQLKRSEDNEKCKNRYQIHSETSDVIYTIGQEKETGEWVCNCKQFSLFNRDRTNGYRPCKHLSILRTQLLEIERES